MNNEPACMIIASCVAVVVVQSARGVVDRHRGVARVDVVVRSCCVKAMISCCVVDTARPLLVGVVVSWRSWRSRRSWCRVRA